MKTVVFFGSARKNGNTKDLLNSFLNKLEGEVEVIDAYRTKISPCIDCRYCWQKRGCSINDKMQDIYPLIDKADNIVFASPVYFSNMPGPLKNIIDRCQVYWASKLRGDQFEEGSKKGVILLCGGAPSFKKQFTAAEIALKGLFGDFGAETVGKVYVPDTDKVKVKDNKNVKEKAGKIAEKLNNTNID
ncbi:MAG: flavodoxin family protein [Candidatus Cloacimonetes bacterium]|nr:flavodoxin family protein [Candidatus Cloacimonadota bacterium]